MKSRRRWGLGLALTGACLVLLACAAFRMLRASYVLGFRNGKPRVLRIYDRYFGYPVNLADLTIPGTLGPVQLRIYSPSGDAHPTPVVIVHGFAPNGNKDGYLNKVGNKMAEMGYLVVLPSVPAETRYEMRASDMAYIADAIRWAADGTHQQVSAFGVSFGAGLVVPAAVQPSVAGKVKLIFSLSGYNNLDSIGHYYIHDRVNDPAGHRYPGTPPGPLLIASGYLDELVPPRDFPAMRHQLDLLNADRDRTVIQDGTTLLKPDEKDREELDKLQAVNTPEMRQRYIDVLNRHHAEMAAISPASVLPTMKIPIYILHGQNDTIFPEGEVEWMRKELGANRDAHILVSPWISHAFVGQPASLFEKLRVIAFATNLFQQASHPAPLR